MTGSSNTTSFATLTQSYPSIKYASGTTANTISTVTTGATNASIITDIIFRNTGSSALNFDIYIGTTSTTQNKIVQVTIPASSGNNGSASLASLAALAPSLFDLDLAGNRVMTLESGINVSMSCTTSPSADVYIMAKQRNF